MTRLCREYLKAHPGSNSAQVAEGLGVALHEPSYALAKMALAGIVSRVELPRTHSQAPLYAYTLVRDIPPQLSPAEALERRRARNRACYAREMATINAARELQSAKAVRAAPKLHQPAPVRTVAVEPETVEQWMQRTGNRPDSLPPCQYIMARILPRRTPLRGASACP